MFKNLEQEDENYKVNMGSEGKTLPNDIINRTVGY
jgi:hypothetical protein